MRSSSLHAAVRPYVEEAAWHLAGEAESGAEMGFELVDERAGRRPPLYCYRPRVDQFVAARLGDLARMPSHGAAVRALAGFEGLERYLQSLGAEVPRDMPVRVRAALRLLLIRALGDSGELGFDESRFARAYEELERSVFAGRVECVVIVPVLGLDTESDEVPLSDRLALARGEALGDDAPSEAVWPVGADAPSLLAVHRADGEHGGGDDGMVAAGIAFRRLLGALRLWDDGDVRLGPVAYARVDGGAWRAVPLSAPGPPPVGVTLVPAEQEDALRAFCALVARRTPRAGALAWALGRHESACDRPSREALTDVLLALRALLEPEGPGSDLLGPRLAALCAEPHDRAALEGRVDECLALERQVVVGMGASADAVDLATLELRGHLRALLRDVLCGHLDPDLVALAERLRTEAADEQPTLA